MTVKRRDAFVKDAQSSAVDQLARARTTALNAQLNAAGIAALQPYAEGTFVPVVAFGGASVGVTYSTQTGRYTRIGRLYFIDISIVLTSKGSSTGNASITGLPVVAGANGVMNMLGNAFTTVTMPNAAIGIASSSLGLQDFTGSTATLLTNTNFQNTTSFNISGVYSV